MTVNTKKAERRALNFATFDDILRDIETIERARDAGTLTHTGNWSPGQILWHCGAFFDASLDGFPPGAKPPLPLRILGRLIKGKATAPGGEAPTGFKLPKTLQDAFGPPPGTTLEEGIARVRAPIERIKNGAKMTHPSPLFGPMNHEQWTNLQLGHCQMHFSFIKPG